MQTGLQAAIFAFENLHKKLLSGIYKDDYLKYCEDRRIKAVLFYAIRCWRTEKFSLWGDHKVDTPQEGDFYMRAWEIEGWISMLEVRPSKLTTRKIISKKPISVETINKLLKLYYEYKLISLHYVYLNNLTR